MFGIGPIFWGKVENFPVNMGCKLNGLGFWLSVPVGRMNSSDGSCEINFGSVVEVH